MKKVRRNNKGFSLVELIIVIAIMAVLTAVIAPQYLKYVKNSKEATDIRNAQEIATIINVALSDEKITLPTGIDKGLDFTETNFKASLGSLVSNYATGKSFDNNFKVFYTEAGGIEVTDSNSVELYPTPTGVYAD